MVHSAIISRLENLKYLGKIKNFNISIVSKKSEYNDIVKFYAQINNENRIQKISFQASGCSAFMAMCSYFCEMIEGMKVSSALKVNKSDLEKKSNVTLTNDHVTPIIFETFKQLITKYNKGVEEGKITPAELSGEKEEQDIKVNTISHKNAFIDRSLDKYMENPVKPKAQKKEKSLSKESKNLIEETLREVKEEIKSENSLESSNIKEDVEEIEIETKPVEKKSKQSKNNNADVKKTKKSTRNAQKEKIEVVEEISVPTETPIVESPNNIVLEEKQIVKVVEIKEEIAVKHEDDVVEVKSTKTTNEIHLGHLSSLQEKLKTKENHDKSQNNLKSLSSLLHKMEIHKENHQSNKDDEVIVEVEDNKKQKKEKKKKEGKTSIFSWFKKK